MNTPNARERILQTAVKVFAEKSFEGARIDEIAREANVPKSLIYYHFKSKNEILEVLTSDFIKEYTRLAQTDTAETQREKADGLADRMQNVYYEFGTKNEDLLRVMLIDSFKKSTEQPVLFQAIDAILKKEAENNTDPHYDIQERRIAEFFTSFIPSYAYICFAESWCRYFQMDRKKFNRLFLKVYSETHGAYHKNHE